jgi:hypothetical protein
VGLAPKLETETKVDESTGPPFKNDNIEIPIRERERRKENILQKIEECVKLEFAGLRS